MGKAKALAIKGHPTRGKEVIELLEMLGGSNKNNLSGNHSCAYYVNGHQNIIKGIDYIFGYEDMQFFSIEKFLKEYPYKVGDKVHIYVQNDDIDGRCDIEVAEITSMRWDPVRCKIAYEMKDINREFYKEEIKCKVDDNSNKQSECEKCGLHFGLVQCFYKDCPHNTPKSYAVGLKDGKVIECESNKEIVMNENKPLFKTGDVVKLKGCPDKNLFWIVMDVIKDGYIFNDGKKYSFDDQHHFEKSNREVINLQPDKIAYLSINNEDYADQIEIDLGDNYEYKFEMNKLYIVKKNPTYPKTYEEDNYCETLEIKVLGYKVGDVVFTNHAGWIRITNKLWDCYAKEHVYEGVGIINEQEYDNISHKDIIDKMEKDIIDKMETDSVIKNMMESITLSPHITANITDKNNCDIKCSDGYEFYDDNGNLIGNKVIMIPKKPTYPKTYDECCGVLNIPNDERYIDIDVPLDYNKLLSAFTELLICRDAYWKIAGEELGLGKSWEYDHTKGYYTPAIIYRVGFIQKVENLNKNVILAFPTIEMRNAFAENFKELIEKCKELL